MRGLFIGSGGRPTRLAPHYFILGESRWFEGLAEDMRQVVVPVDELPDEATSFTYPDSFTAMALGPDFGLPHEPKPYHERVFRLSELSEVIDRYGLPSEAGAGYQGYALRPFELYVEIQLWTDEPIRRFLHDSSDVPPSRGAFDDRLG